jgi:RNA polymerase sigma-70 factor (ECF subfamily)
LDPPDQETPNPASSDGVVKELQKAMLRLPERERLALHAFYLQGRSVEQARAVLGLSRSGMYRVLERARKRLERLMRHHREDMS